MHIFSHLLQSNRPGIPVEQTCSAPLGMGLAYIMFRETAFCYSKIDSVVPLGKFLDEVAWVLFLNLFLLHFIVL